MRTHIRRLECGSADGGVFADLVILPMLFALVLVGLFIMLIGFYRIGANYSTQQGALVGSVSPGTGAATLISRWMDWTSGNFPSGGFVVDDADRAAQANVGTSQTFQFYGLGAWLMPISGQTYTRSERFYPGGPVCDGSNCSE